MCRSRPWVEKEKCAKAPSAEKIHRKSPGVSWTPAPAGTAQSLPFFAGHPQRSQRLSSRMSVIEDTQCSYTARPAQPKFKLQSGMQLGLGWCSKLRPSSPQGPPASASLWPSCLDNPCRASRLPEDGDLGLAISLMKRLTPSSQLRGAQNEAGESPGWS